MYTHWILKKILKRVYPLTKAAKTNLNYMYLDTIHNIDKCYKPNCRKI